MKSILLSLGHVRSIIVLTTFSVVVSLLLTYLIIYFFGQPELMKLGIIIAIIVPLILAPLIATNLNKLLFQTLELEEKMRNLANTDYLTQLFNRREWITQTSQYIHLAARNSHYFAILMLDLDDFKSINDNYSHTAGDKVLIAFAEIIKSTCRSSDIPARFGGEEFIILLPDTSEQQAMKFAERLQQLTHSLKMNIEGNVITITASIGINIFYPDKPAKLDTLISQADKALYQAKQQGKNCTIVFHD